MQLYFPGEQAPLADVLGPRGLADLGRDKGPEVAPIDRGPDGKRGMLAVWRTGDAARDVPLSLLPGWDWQPCRPQKKQGLAKGAYWVGFNPKRPPRPEDVARTPLYPGYWTRLRDGHQWHIPAAAKLPHCHALGPDGQYERTIDSRFADFWERSRGYAQVFLTACGQLELLRRLHGKDAPEKTKVDFPLAETFAFAVEALALNYRVNAEIVTRLNLLDDDGLSNVLKLACDLPVLLTVEDEKKKRASVSIPVG